MSFSLKALSQQIRICEKVAETATEIEDVEFWKSWLEQGRQAQAREHRQVVNFATGKGDADEGDSK